MKFQQDLLFTYAPSPLGDLLLAGTDQHLVYLGFPQGNKAMRHQPRWQQSAAPFAQVRVQLEEYFAGDRDQFELPLAPPGTEFQLKVLAALQQIPYGETWSYLQLATHIGNPKAVRAVGGANGNNPIPIIIPCHRVIGSNGSLTGFGGGIEAKKLLLDLEERQQALFS